MVAHAKAPLGQVNIAIVVVVLKQKNSRRRSHAERRSMSSTTMSNHRATSPVADKDQNEGIQRAVRFLSAPAVLANPNTNEKVQYLLTKGLSHEEVNLAMQLVEGDTQTEDQQMAQTAPTTEPSKNEKMEEAPNSIDDGNTQGSKRGGTDMVVLLGGRSQSSSNNSINESTDLGEEQSVEAALVTMKTLRLREKIDDVVKRMGSTSSTISDDTTKDVPSNEKYQEGDESIYDIDEDVDSLVVMATGDAANAPPSIPLLDSRDGDDVDDEDCSVYDCDEASAQSNGSTDEDNYEGEGLADDITPPSKQDSTIVQKKNEENKVDDDEGTLVTTDSSEIGTAYGESRSGSGANYHLIAQGWEPQTPTRADDDDFDPVEMGRASPSASPANRPPSPDPSEGSIDEISRALSEIRSDDVMVASDTSSIPTPFESKKIDVISSGLPLLYLGPIDLKRPARYSSLANCVIETLRLHNNRCILANYKPKRNNVIVLFGPAPSIRDDDRSNCWYVTQSGRENSSGDASVSSGQRSWAPVSVDDLSAEVSSVSDVRRAHLCVAKALQCYNYNEAIEILTDLLEGLAQASQKRHFHEFNVDEMVETTKRNLATINLIHTQYAEASRGLQDILRFNPGDVSCRALLGLAQVATEDLEEASTTFLEILVQLDKGGHEMTSQIGDIQVAKGTILNNLACCFIKRGEFVRAKTVYERALDCLLGCQDIAKSALTLSNLAKCLVQTKEYDLALDTLGSSVENLQNYVKREESSLEWHYVTGIMKARALVAASVKQYMLALDTYEEMLNQLDYKTKDQYDLILEIYVNMAQITSEIGKHTPESGATYLKMIEARKEDVKRMRSRHFDSLNLDLLT